MPSSIGRGIRRHFLGATRITGDSRWIVEGPVRGSSFRTRVNWYPSVPYLKATEGAEKSCRPRRRKRGLRVGKSRSRVGKTRPILPHPTPDFDDDLRRRVLQRSVREDLWASARAKTIFVKVVSPIEVRYGKTWRRRDGVWEKIDRVWLPFKRQVVKMRGPGSVSLSIARHYVEKCNQPPVDSWDEVGFGSPQITPGDWLTMRALRRPTAMDLFPDSGPITLGEWKRRLEVRIHRRTRSVVPCRCRRSHVYCDECGACIYAGSNHHRPRDVERQ
jgi:hypothetical protein